MELEGDWTRGWNGVNLVFPYSEVNLLMFSTKCHFSVNVSLGELKRQQNFYKI